MPASLSKIQTAKNKVRLKGIRHDKKKQMRLFLLGGGILLLILGFFLSSPPVQFTKSDKASVDKLNVGDEVTSFLQEPVKVDKTLLSSPKTKDKAKNPPIRIIIPVLNVDLPVKEAKAVKGYWEVFADSAGYGIGSAYPDEVGNQVIFAHAKQGLFLPLKEAKLGQIIYVLTKNAWYSYMIDEIKEVIPSQTEVIAPTKDAILTLYTCSGFADSKRLIVVAKRI